MTDESMQDDVWTVKNTASMIKIMDVSVTDIGRENVAVMEEEGTKTDDVKKEPLSVQIEVANEIHSNSKNDAIGFEDDHFKTPREYVNGDYETPQQQPQQHEHQLKESNVFFTPYPEKETTETTTIPSSAAEITTEMLEHEIHTDTTIQSNTPFTNDIASMEQPSVCDFSKETKEDTFLPIVHTTTTDPQTQVEKEIVNETTRIETVVELPPKPTLQNSDSFGDFNNGTNETTADEQIVYQMSSIQPSATPDIDTPSLDTLNKGIVITDSSNITINDETVPIEESAVNNIDTLSPETVNEVDDFGDFNKAQTEIQLHPMEKTVTDIDVSQSKESSNEIIDNFGEFNNVAVDKLVADNEMPAVDTLDSMDNFGDFNNATLVSKIEKDTVNEITSIDQSGVDLNASSPDTLHRSDDFRDDQNNLNKDLSSIEKSVADAEINNEMHMTNSTEITKVVDSNEEEEFGDFGDFKDSNISPEQTNATVEKSTSIGKFDDFNEANAKATVDAPNVSDSIEKSQELAHAIENDDEFGDFGSFNDAVGTEQPLVNNDSCPTENIGNSMDDDEFGDFNDFNEAPVSEKLDSIGNNNNDINATEIVNDDDDFGGFGDFNTVNANDTSDVVNESNAVLQSENTDDDFGDFGDFNAPPESTTEHATLHEANTASSAGPTNEATSKTNQKEAVTSMDDDDDFGDFGGFEDPTSTNEVQEKPLKDAFVEKAESVFQNVFQRYKDATNSYENESHQPFAHVSISDALVSRQSSITLVMSH